MYDRFCRKATVVLIIIGTFMFFVVHTPTNALFIKLGKVLKFILKYTLISLLHVSVYDRYQGACTAPD